jgi:hypothetical protein
LLSHPGFGPCQQLGTKVYAGYHSTNGPRCHRICMTAPSSDSQYCRLPSNNESTGSLGSMGHKSHAHTRTLLASSDSHNPAKLGFLSGQPASDRGYVLLHHRIHIMAFNFTASVSHNKPGVKIFISRHCPSGLSLRKLKVSTRILKRGNARFNPHGDA